MLIGKLVESTALAAIAIFDRVLHHATIIAINGKSYRLRNKDAKLPADDADPRPANLPTGSQAKKKAKSQRDNSSEEAAWLAKGRNINDYPTLSPRLANLPIGGWI
jgi:hypothetical protein